MKHQIQLYYKNATAEVIGSEHGIPDTELIRSLDKLSRNLVKLRSNSELRKKEDAFRRLPFETETPKRVKELAGSLRGDCENLVVLGIGGSALGNIAVQTALNPYMYHLDDSVRRGKPGLFVFDNVDPAQFGSFLGWIGERLDKTVFNVISKSGKTAETASQFLVVRNMLLDKLGKDGLKKNVIATTDPEKGLLRKIADETGMRSLEVPSDVGGRFSVLSAVGLFSAAMCGIDIDGLLAGARDMDKRVSSEELKSNPAAIIAALHYYFYRQGKRISVMIPYSWALKDFADWYRQLLAESLGKSKDWSGKEVHIGITPVKALGATDQHSQVQLYREGPNDKVFTFLEVADFGRKVITPTAPKEAGELEFLAGKDLGELLNCEKKATEYALRQDKCPCISIIFPQVNAYTVGGFIYLYETAITFMGALFEINPFDQPAVELGKEATFALMGMKGYCKLANSDYSEFAEKIRASTEVDEKYLV